MDYWGLFLKSTKNKQWHQHLAQCDVNLDFNLKKANKNKINKNLFRSHWEYRNKQFSMEESQYIFFTLQNQYVNWLLNRYIHNLWYTYFIYYVYTM